MTKNKQRKVYRYWEIMLVINVPDTRDYSDVPDDDLVARFEEVNFINQAELERVLLDLRIDSKNSETRLEDFKGQLERGDKNRRPHWQLFLKVEHQTTAVAVAKAIALAIFKLPTHTSIQAKRAVDISNASDYVLKPGSLKLDDIAWQPGIISKSTAEFRRGLAEEPGLQAILERSYPYQKYLIPKIEGPADDRSVVIINDFAGGSGKSKFVSLMRKLGHGIQVAIDEPRAMAKAVNIEAMQFEAIHGKEPPNVFFDMTRQVPEKYIDGFYSIVEQIKKKFTCIEFHFPFSIGKIVLQKLFGKY